MNIGIMGKIHPNGLEVFKNNNISFIDLESFDKDYLIKNLKNVDGIVLRTARLDKDILKELTKLKIVSRHGVGYDNVDIDFLNDNKIALAITGTANSVSVAEHVMTMILNLTKNIVNYDKLVKSGNFVKKMKLVIFSSSIIKKFSF